MTHSVPLGVCRRAPLLCRRRQDDPVGRLGPPDPHEDLAARRLRRRLAAVRVRREVNAGSDSP